MKVADFLSLEISDDPVWRALSAVDITEPVAAAVSLFQTQVNAREICAVIDIGAGTTDMGLMLVLTPDEELDKFGNPFTRKLIRLAEPLSINYAGDYIDYALIDLYTFKASNSLDINSPLFERKVEIFSHQIRRIKQDLFDYGQANFDEVTILINEFEALPAITFMKNVIAKSFIDMVYSARDRLEHFLELKLNGVKHIDLVFAGGGYKIDFIRSAIPKSVTLNTWEIVIKVRENDDKSDPNKAMMESRLAECRGGGVAPSDWPNTNLESSVLGTMDFGI